MIFLTARRFATVSCALLTLCGVTTSEAAPFPSTSWKDIEVVGIDSVTVGHNVRLLGSLAAIGRKGLMRLSADITQVDGTAPDRNFVAGATLEFGNRTSVQDVYFNKLLHGAGSYYIRGVRQPQGFPLPVATPTLPVEWVDSCVERGPDILVDRNQSRALSPGCFGIVEVRDGGRLELAAGSYKMRTLRLNQETRLTTTGKVNVYIRRAVDLGDDSIVGPQSGLPDDLIFWARTDSNTTSHIGRRTRLIGRIVAPFDGNLLLLRDARIIGSVLGRKVHLKQDIDPGVPALPTPSPLPTSTPKPSVTPGPTSTPGPSVTPGPTSTPVATATPVPSPTGGVGPPSTPRPTPAPTPCVFSPCVGF